MIPKVNLIKASTPRSSTERAQREREKGEAPSAPVVVVRESIEDLRGNLIKGAAIYAGIGLVAIGIGAAISTYAFFGTIMLAGVVVVVESNKVLKKVVTKSNKLIDFTILIVSVIATIKYSITISAALTFAGLGYTLIYSPWIRYSELKQIENK